MKDIALIFPPFLPSATKAPYLSTHLLATILKEAGHKTKCYDFNMQMNNDLVDSVVYSDLLEGEDRSNIIKSIHKAIKIVDNDEINVANNTEWIKYRFHNHLASEVLKSPKSLQDFFELGANFHPRVLELLTLYAENLLENQHDTIAISVAFGEQLIYSIELIKIIKSRSPNTVVFLGGAQISLLDGKQITLLKKNSQADLIFQGYAEQDIVNIVNKFGIAEEAIAIKGGTATRESLKRIPYVDFDLPENHTYQNQFPVLVTKGCYWGKCEFCDYVLMGDIGKDRYIARPVENVYGELKALRQKYPNAGFSLVSDAVPPQFYKKLAVMANAENFPLHTMSYMINNKSLNEEFFKELAQAKVGSFCFGTESTSDRVLRLMNKQATRAIIIDNLRLAKKYGVRVKVNLIPNYPSTTYEEALSAYKICYLFKDIISSLAVFKFYLSANTNMFRNPTEFDIEIDSAPYLKSEHNGYHTAEYKTKGGMTPEQEQLIYDKLENLNRLIQRGA